jgi:hypothetical protein
MMLQYLLVAVALLAAVLYLGRQAWLTWTRSGRGCGGGCCSEATKPPGTSSGGMISTDELTARLRKNFQQKA